MTKDELARRLRAARAYSGLTQEELGQALGFSEPKMNRLEHGRYKRTLAAADEEGVTRSTAQATGLPHEFFSIEFSDLPAMVQHWQQVGAPGWSGELDQEQAAAELESELEREARRGETNGTHSEGSEPGSQSH